MKKIIFLAVVSISFLTSIQAQIEMNSAGKVGIGASPSSYYSLYVSPSLSVSNYMNVPYIYLTNISTIGGSSSTFNTSYLSIKHPVYPMFTTSLGINMTPVTTYALDVNGSVRCTYGIWVISDQIYKKNIEQINGKTAMDMLLQVKGRTYEYKTCDELLALYDSGELQLNVDTVSIIEKNEDDQEVLVEKVQIEVPEFSGGRSYGFVAQEIKDILPELVSFDSTVSTYSISYDGFIPIMLEAIKEQQEEIEDLKQLIANTGSLKGTESITMSSSNLDIDKQTTTLFQNAPNPFSKETKIKYYLEDQVGNAMIYIYDMNGKQLRSNELHLRGSGEITINGSELDAGMYMYTLIADGQLIDTKQMILTD
ncbi:MAG: T9SS type A sorting domain-containing protein [Bacteroidota bacterium]